MPVGVQLAPALLQVRKRSSRVGNTVVKFRGCRNRHGLLDGRRGTGHRQRRNRRRGRKRASTANRGHAALRVLAVAVQVGVADWCGPCSLLSSCTEVVMVNRRTIPLAADARLRQVIMDTGAANFASEIAELARTCSAQGEPLYAASCIGIGKGSQQWSEEDIKKLEIGLVGAFARGCLAAGIERFGLLSAAGSSAKSWIRYARIMGEKEDAVRSLGFKRLAIFRPGIIAGNAHTPGFLALLGRFVPGSFGTIDQDDIGRAFVGEFLHGQDGTTILENAAMKQRRWPGSRSADDQHSE